MANPWDDFLGVKKSKKNEPPAQFDRKDSKGKVVKVSDERDNSPSGAIARGVYRALRAMRDNTQEE